jgi:hypothetical protein
MEHLANVEASVCRALGDTPRIRKWILATARVPPVLMQPRLHESSRATARDRKRPFPATGSPRWSSNRLEQHQNHSGSGLVGVSTTCRQANADSSWSPKSANEHVSANRRVTRKITMVCAKPAGLNRGQLNLKFPLVTGGSEDTHMRKPFERQDCPYPCFVVFRNLNRRTRAYMLGGGVAVRRWPKNWVPTQRQL